MYAGMLGCALVCTDVWGWGVRRSALMCGDVLESVWVYMDGCGFFFYVCAPSF